MSFLKSMVQSCFQFMQNKPPEENDEQPTQAGQASSSSNFESKWASANGESRVSSENNMTEMSNKIEINQKIEKQEEEKTFKSQKAQSTKKYMIGNMDEDNITSKNEVVSPF